MVATLLYMVVDLEGGQVRYASAGHLPALLREDGGATRFLEHPPSLPLGVAEHTTFQNFDAALEPGGLLMLYTDGLVERRSETIDAGLARLREVLANGPQNLEELCSHTLASVPGGAILQDDAALLAVRLAEDHSARLELELPAEPEAVSTARHRLERWLAETGEGHDDVLAIKLALSEACANAVEHAYGPGQGHTFELLVERLDGEVVIEVSDKGHWRAARGSRRGLGLGMIDQLMDSVEVKRTSSGTTVRMRKAPTL